VKNTLIVNPGEVGTWLYGKSTAAIVDLNKMEAEIVEL
jgi:predicted phosphodiesterase